MGAGRASRKKNPGGNQGHREQKMVAMEHSAKKKQKKQKRQRLQSTREHLDRDELVGILYESVRNGTRALFVIFHDTNRLYVYIQAMGEQPKPPLPPRTTENHRISSVTEKIRQLGAAS
ncbi:hypothetical protein M404DRAFT_21673 [Pisolithus tinctorius Marx 270]|uniref:Uncharacterized protein n=1 Tax=Pisolithus tinctorius Marx 270 TaxID=870435 RepID=A0A0C3JLI9_PISTI|nr:hypothetical protein M404DRAFT_21673 [Pisolithus tinctorius Marx 270]